jgi:hypothetical protein
MKKRILFCVLIGVFVFFSLSFIINTDKDKEFSCDNLGIVYAKELEIDSMSTIKDKGVIIFYPELNIYSAKTEVLECPTIDLYLGHLRQ